MEGLRAAREARERHVAQWRAEGRCAACGGEIEPTGPVRPLRLLSSGASVGAAATMLDTTPGPPCRRVPIRGKGLATVVCPGPNGR